MVAASVLDDAWLEVVADSPGPYFFVAEGVLVYLPGEEVTRTLAHLATRFPAACLALDTYTRSTLHRQLRMAAQRNMAEWKWACDDPRSLERLGLQIIESVPVTRPPSALRGQLPARYRYLLPLADPVFGQALRVTLFQASPGR